MTVMKRIARILARFTFNGIARLFSGSVAMGIGAAKFWAVHRHVGDSIPCPACSSDISLLGLWECGRCRYSWYGFYFAACTVCGDLPAFVDCGRCGASAMNPFL